jgi:PAS domain-containing protein
MINFPDEILTDSNNSDNTIGESLVRYNLLSKTTSEGIWDFNLQTGAVYYNETIYNMLGYSVIDMQDNISWWRGNIHPHDRERVIK